MSTICKNLRGSIMVYTLQERGKNIRKHRRNEQKTPSCVLLTKKTHLAEQTGAPRKMHIMVNTRAHLSACKRKEHLGEVHQGSAEPLVQTNLDGLPYRCTLGWSGAYSTSSQGDKVSIQWITWSSPYSTSTTI